MFLLTFEEAKSLLKDLQNDKKKVLKGSKQSVFVGEKVSLEHRVEFVLNMYKNFHTKFEEEYERARLARFNTEPLKEWGFQMVNGIIKELPKSEFKGKYNDVELAKWTEDTFPKITDELWDVEYAENALIEYLKTFSK